MDDKLDDAELQILNCMAFEREQYEKRIAPLIKQLAELRSIRAIQAVRERLEGENR